MAIGGVHFHAFFVASVCAPVDLPSACYARTHGTVLLRGGCVMVQFFACDRAWPYERHVALQDVPYLRQLVEGGAAQETPKSCNAWIVGQLLGFMPLRRCGGICTEVAIKDRVRMQGHCPNFPAYERFAVFADPPVAEK